MAVNNLLCATGSATEKGASPKLYHAGTLAYTKASLFVLFSWLLWGDFSFSLMETAWASVLPLELHSLQAPNMVVSLIVLTIPQMMAFILNPIISTFSDRYRGRFGRRIPFLLFATPFVTVFLVLLSFSRPLGALLYALLNSNGYAGFSASSVTIGLIGVLIIGFRLFETFINTVYWYLFNDVVPAEFLGRFLGLFRVVGTAAGVLYNFFIYRHAQSHASWIFLGAGLLYGAVFLLMCLKVKEGTYPPPDLMTQGSRSPWAYLATFGRECFTHRIFILTYLAFASMSLILCTKPFDIFMALSLGLTMEQVGKICAGAGILVAALIYPAGVLVDRLHPIRMMLFASAGLCLVTPVNLIFLFFKFPPSVVFYLYIGIAAVIAPLSAVWAACGLPLLMRIFPHERYGQFCAANGMVTSATVVIGSVLAGLFLDSMKTLHHGSDFAYRYIPVWNTVSFLCAFALVCLFFREWKKLGGDKHYCPPCPDKFRELYEP